MCPVLGRHALRHTQTPRSCLPPPLKSAAENHAVPSTRLPLPRAAPSQPPVPQNPARSPHPLAAAESQKQGVIEGVVRQYRLRQHKGHKGFNGAQSTNGLIISLICPAALPTPCPPPAARSPVALHVNLQLSLVSTYYCSDQWLEGTKASHGSTGRLVTRVLFGGKKRKK
ncbi:hypothetical protein E2C01_017216 [Portunus trituberculatus]|uniref:Uncharacterized protein n=1 Tax=Portunus trituberculatus TaxID=210409 RepID=A0A5B7DST5_PORTR|nr:hypothetical protein [Portunus trituberculatus]